MEAALIVQPFELRGHDNDMCTCRMEIDKASKQDRTKIEVDSKKLQEAVQTHFAGHPFVTGQKFVVNYQSSKDASCPLKLTILDLDNRSDVMKSQANEQFNPKPRSEGSIARVGVMPRAGLEIEFKAGASQTVQVLSSDMRKQQVFKKDFNFGEMGIGGLGSELETIFRKAFASRVYPPALIRKLGVKHVRGMMLYGPPGTGKTTIARQIGQCLNSREPVIKSGPEMLNMYSANSRSSGRPRVPVSDSECDSTN